MREEISASYPFDDGVIIPVNKPYEWSSGDVIRKIKAMLRSLGFKKIKIGHAGTLDPLATGVLLVCIGRSATKRVDELQAEEKEYLTDIELGATTPSGDMEHPVDQRFPYEHITHEMVETALAELSGERLQTPPVYSAKSIDGKRAYEYAREGKEVEMRQALINIYSMTVEEFELPRVRVRIRCSKGTYIRSIAMELGDKLGCGGHLTSLCRTQSGNYRVENCYAIDELNQILST